jgi:hypothetical protein
MPAADALRAAGFIPRNENPAVTNVIAGLKPARLGLDRQRRDKPGGSLSHCYRRVVCGA